MFRGIMAIPPTRSRTCQQCPKVNIIPPISGTKRRSFQKAPPEHQNGCCPSRTQGSPCELKTGFVIPGIILSGIGSDLPRQLIGQVAQNVYDSRVVAGQSRVLVAWNRIIFQDGSSITLGSMSGTDMAGYSVFSDQTNNRYLRTFGSAAIMSLISGISAFGLDSFKSDTAQNDKPSLQDELGSALSSELGKSSQRLLQQNLNVQLSLSIRPGYRFNLVVKKDIVFGSPYRPWR